MQQSQTAAIAVRQSEKTVVGHGETTIINGKYFLDLSKLIFAGIVLTGIKENNSWDDPILIVGFIVMLLFYVLGIGIVKYGNNIKNKI